MTGPHDSIIGTEVQAALARFLTGLPSRFEPASGNPRLHAVIVTADEKTGKAVAIERLALTEADVKALRAESRVEVEER
jgi:hypothetical protein